MAENQAINSNEIDLIELFRSLYQYKISIFLCTLMFGCTACITALTTSKTYQADVLITSTKGDSDNSQLSSFASRYAGLATIAGINVAYHDTNIESSLALLESRKFILSLIKEEELKPVLFPQLWESNTSTWQEPETDYSCCLQDLFTTEDSNQPVPLIPSDTASYLKLKDMLKVSTLQKSGLVRVSVKSDDPEVAANIANKLVSGLNEYLRNEAIAESKANMRYLEQEISKTSLVEFQSILYKMIESEASNIMLAKVQKEYAFKVIDPAFAPETAVGPRSAPITSLGLLLGLVIGCTQALIRIAISNR
ncbi:MAG: Wzz/FepE/Etk N-terminal domain-containing protein [Gammaproteobacteria bacterium]|nr:Wzz/FepE/Etk N-terminal domain-containing protein [Gammaproteobacteria bacterium]